MRRLVSNPERTNREAELKKNFCDGCFVCFDTSIGETSRRWGSELEFDEIYEIGERGRPVRKPSSVTGLSD